MLKPQLKGKKWFDEFTCHACESLGKIDLSVIDLIQHKYYKLIFPELFLHSFYKTIREVYKGITIRSSIWKP